MKVSAIPGGECNRSRDVTFGYNTYSRCWYRSAESNCNRFREEVEAKLNATVKGSFLAPFGNYRDANKPAIPVLRDYRRTNSTECTVPVQQDVIVQYETVRTELGAPVHRAVGVTVSRTYGSAVREASLTIRVMFVPVTPTEERQLSRFWKKVLTPEQSENAWLYMFRVFDGPLDEDIEESTFWTLLFFVVVCGTIAVLRDSR
ncbi:UNVERIFIED_CONTAM: hypothetical protein PYX00_005337 [Menopon gallinae]|uniref:Tectonic-1-3 domain-containing protein n=1 Tax=Menopon gallinae TaxID=328185 RepID=A0AAW2HRB0_9NEOP